MEYLVEKTNLTPKGTIISILKRNGKDFCGSIIENGEKNQN